MGTEVKEIDLLELFVKVYLFLKEHIKAFILIGILGGIVGLSFGFIKPAKYKYQLVCYSPIMSTSLLEEIVGELKEKDFLHDIIGSLPDSLLEKRKMSFSVELGAIEKDDKYLSITFVCKKPFSPAITEFIVKQAVLKNDYAKEMLADEHNKLQNIIAFLDQEIVRQKNITDANEAQVVVNSEESVADLFIKKEDYSQKLQLLRPVVFAKSTNKVLTEEPSAPIGAVGGAFTGCLVLLLFFGFKFLNGLAKDAASPNKKNVVLMDKTA